MRYSKFPVLTDFFVLWKRGKNNDDAARHPRLAGGSGESTATYLLAGRDTFDWDVPPDAANETSPAFDPLMMRQQRIRGGRTRQAQRSIHGQGAPACAKRQPVRSRWSLPGWSGGVACAAHCLHAGSASRAEGHPFKDGKHTAPPARCASRYAYARSRRRTARRRRMERRQRDAGSADVLLGCGRGGSGVQNAEAFLSQGIHAIPQAAGRGTVSTRFRKAGPESGMRWHCLPPAAPVERQADPDRRLAQ